jgi:hypothetical protein
MALGLSLAMAAPALAQADFVGGGGDDLWSNANNWSPVGVPTLASGALRVRANADVQTNANRIGGVLAVDPGNELIINADFGHALTETNHDVWLNGTITQNGGDVFFSDDTRPAGGTHTMNGGTFVNRDYYRWDAASLLDIRGGSFTIGVFFNPNGKTGTLKVVGDAATLISFGKVESFSAGTLDIVLKGGGITTIDVTNDANLPGTLNVTLDAGFTPVAGDYTLISAGSLSGSIGTESLPSGDWSVATVGNDVVLTYAPLGPLVATNTAIGAGCGGLSVAANTRPVIGTSWDLSLNGIPSTGTIGAEIYGLTDPGISNLTGIGLPGCGLRAALDYLNAFLVGGSTHAYSLVLPNDPTIVGMHVFTTGAVFLNPPTNSFGAITGSAIDGMIGDV